MNNTGKKFGGRTKGVQNKTSAQTKELLKNIVGNQLDKIESLLNKMDPVDRCNIVVRMLPFVLPKQSEILIEAVPAGFEPLTVTLIEPNGQT
jgi:hypothetical protein